MYQKNKIILICMIEIIQISTLSDNYSYLVVDKETNITACVDPAVSSEIISTLNSHDLSLDYIMNTHHHHDHVGGNNELKNKYNCKIIGGYLDRDRIPGIDISLKENEIFKLGNSEFEVIETSGHTIGHIAYYFKEDSSLFCGDTLFSLGCGRIFEGSYLQMLKSLLKIRALPDDTLIYCGHEYTLSNAKFASHINPSDKFLKEKIIKIEEKLNNLGSTVPSNLGEEKMLNPFLNFDNKNYLELIGFTNGTDLENFKRMRIMKDNF